MSERIVYHDDGRRTFFLQGKEVAESTFRAATINRDARTFSDMIEAGTPPHGVSDQTYMKGFINGSQFEKNSVVGDFYKQECEANGGTVNNKRYISGLAAYPGDPEAWVTGRDDVKRLLEKRGWSGEGMVNVPKRESVNPPTPGPEVADDIVEGYAHAIAMNDPNPHLVDMEDLKGQVKERIKPRKHKKAPRSEVIA